VTATIQGIRSFDIAVLPGDGIGVEVTAEAVRLLQALQHRLNRVTFAFHEYSVGAGEYLKRGNPLPAEALNACAKADAVLLGAMGLPSVRWPDGKEMTPQLDLREKFQLYCGLRPIRLYHERDTPLKRYGSGGSGGFPAADSGPNANEGRLESRPSDTIDFVIVRESTEGLFSARLSKTDPAKGEVCDVMRITRTGAERVCRAAFQQAMKRRKHCTLVDKANVLPSMVFFRSVFDAVAKEFPDVKTDHIYVDAAALYLVQRPHTFDVLVTENMFGDILSDLAAGLVGGMGMAPSADIGDDCAVFQPSHGTAPDIAGKGIANPVATILSAALMLEWLEHPETLDGALRIRRAVETALADPANRTPDLGGKLTTTQMADKIVAAL
jgi:3-isopropylmalate dehydrogenase